MKKVIITGGTGFIGKWIVKELLNNGVEVIVISRENSKNINELNNLPVKIVECDLENIDKLPELIKDRDIDTFYHIAWQGVSDSDLKSSEVQINNVIATLKILDVMKKMNIETFVGAGSLHEIEGQIEMNKNTTITNMGCMYKSAKNCAHLMAKAKAGDLGIRFLWPIITNTYGEGEKSGRLINTIIRRVLNNESMDLSAGDQNYDFIHISDLARAFYLIGDKGKDGHNYIVSSGKVKPLKEYLKVVEKLANEISGNSIELNFGGLKSSPIYLDECNFDISNLIEDTGFKPNISFEEGIKKTIKWIIQN